MPPETEAKTEPDGENEPEYVGKKRHVSVFCPVCGMLCKARRYQVDHVFPNVMETFYGGRGKISREYLVDGDPAIPALQNVVLQKVVKTAIEELSLEQKKELIIELQKDVKIEHNTKFETIKEEIVEELEDDDDEELEPEDFDDMQEAYLNQDFTGNANI